MFTPSQLKGRTQDVQRTHKAVEKQKKNRNLQYVHERRHFSWPVLAALCVHCQMRTNLFLSQRYWIHHHRHRMFQCLLTMFFVRIKHFRGMKGSWTIQGKNIWWEKSNLPRSVWMMDSRHRWSSAHSSCWPRREPRCLFWGCDPQLVQNEGLEKALKYCVSIIALNNKRSKWAASVTIRLPKIHEGTMANLNFETDSNKLYFVKHAAWFQCFFNNICIIQ